MNERIKELADKSGFGPAWYDPTIPTSDIDRRWIDQRRLKEFAELIVRECAEIIKQDGFYISSPTGEKKPCNPFEISDMVKEHFGVEK